MSPFLIERGMIMDFTVSEAAKTKLDVLLQERGLTDVFFVMDYVDGDSPFLWETCFTKWIKPKKRLEKNSSSLANKINIQLHR